MKKIFCIILLSAFSLFFIESPAFSNFKWESVETRYLSDIYLKGSLLSAKSEDTIYSWDFKLAYPNLLYKNLGSGKKWLIL